MFRFIAVALVACSIVGSAVADVSHLTSHYLPPMRAMMKMQSLGSNDAGLRQTVTTSIEKQELRELPTQTEYLQPGQMPYGIGNANENANSNVIYTSANSNSDNNNSNGNDNNKANKIDMRPLSMLMPQELMPMVMEQLKPQLKPQLKSQQSTPPTIVVMHNPPMQYLPPQAAQQPEQQQAVAPTAEPSMSMQYMQPPPVTAPMPTPAALPMPAALARQYLAPEMQSATPPMTTVEIKPTSMTTAMSTLMAMPEKMPSPASHYLPPNIPQPTYQQYQAQQLAQSRPEPQPTMAATSMPLPMPAEFVQQHRQLMQYEFSFPSGVETNIQTLRELTSATAEEEAESVRASQPEPEPEPAHFLTADGYHYRNGVVDSSTASRRFRARH